MAVARHSVTLYRLAQAHSTDLSVYAGEYEADVCVKSLEAIGDAPIFIVDLLS